ncbi:MAG: hypothetical protein AAFN78_07030 [Pseudomonadota bacterium]
MLRRLLAFAIVGFLVAASLVSAPPVMEQSAGVKAKSAGVATAVVATP